MTQIMMKNAKYSVEQIYNILKQNLPYKTRIYNGHIEVRKSLYYSTITITPNLSCCEMKIDEKFPIWFLIIGILFIPLLVVLLAILLYIYLVNHYFYPPFEKEVISVILFNQKNLDYSVII